MLDPIDIFKAFNTFRNDSIVTTSGTAGRHWNSVSTNKSRDITLGGAMGHTISAAFGLALGLPDEKIVLFDSEGALLMNLGVMASIGGKKPSNFIHILLDNGCYATTGGQPVPNAENIDYVKIAEGAGYASAHHFNDIEEFATNIKALLDEEGPIFISMKIMPEIQNTPIGLRPPRSGPTRSESIESLREELGII